MEQHKTLNINPENSPEIEDFNVYIESIHLIQGKSDQDWSTLGIP